jgi:hypothetical protein
MAPPELSDPQLVLVSVRETSGGFESVDGSAPVPRLDVAGGPMIDTQRRTVLRPGPA